MTLRTLSILTGITLAAVLVPACSGGAQRAPEQSRAAVPADSVLVDTAAVALTEIPDEFEAGGIVAARTTASLMARIHAPVREVHAVPGDRVRAGQVLIVLDGRDLAAQARRARAQGTSADQDVIASAAERQAAQAGLALARATHARIAGLQAKQSATAQELDDATGALRAAEARAAGAEARAQAAVSNVEVARAASEAAETIETFSRIAAPFDGVVTEKLVEPGNMAAPGTPLMRVEDTRRFRLEVRVDESRLEGVSPGVTVPIALEGWSGDAVRVVDGTVTEVGRAVDADARSLLIKIELPADGRLRSGMFGRARFSTQARRALTVPETALVQHGQVRSVYVVEKDIARVRLVNVRGTEVLAGLSEGEVVIVNPPPALTDGRRVTVGGR
jgi:RND family efflux transporter MFP subunit